MKPIALLSLVLLVAGGVIYLAWPGSSEPTDDTLELQRPERAADPSRPPAELEASAAEEVRTAVRSVDEPDPPPTAPAGGSLTGRVVDTAGQAIAGAELTLQPARERQIAFGEPLARTAGDGAFTLALPDGKWIVRAAAAGFGARFQGAFDGALEYPDTRFVLGQGDVVRGRVVWADDRPASGARVVVRSLVKEDHAQRRLEPFTLRGAIEAGAAFSDETGAFTIVGVQGGPRALLASARDADGRTWGARADAVTPGEDVVLRLGPARRITVEVLDDLGQPLTGDGRLALVPVEAEGVQWTHPLARSIPFALDADGVQVLSGIAPGDWRVYAFKPFHVPAADRGATSGDGARVRLVLKRPGRIEGRVLDSEGLPIADATIEVNGREAEGARPSDPDGRFTIPAVRAGQGLLMTEVHGAPAELAFEVAPGEVLTDVELVVPAGAFITGTFLDRDGSVVPDSEVMLLIRDGEAGKVTTDAEGAFRFGPLPPGPCQVAGLLHMRFDGTPAGELLQHLVTARVELRAGETLELVLRAPQQVPVEIAGLVTVGGVPASGCTVLCSREGDSLVEGLQIVKTTAEGRYGLTVDRPGRYVFLFQPQGRTSPGTPRPVTVPASDGVTFDVDLSAGGIAGTLVAPDGRPVAGLVHVDALDLVFPFPGSERGQQTNDDGRFEVRFLDPGRYVVRGMDGFGRVSAPLEVSVGPGGVRGLTVQLAAPCRLQGVVRDEAGQPLAGAQVTVQTPTGRRVELGALQTHAGGRFATSVPAGRYLVSARAPGSASARVDAVARADAETEVELTLAPAAELRVRVRDGETAVSAAIRVFDGDGVEVSDLALGQAEAGAFVTPTRTSERLLGPLPPGDYDVHVRALDGRERRASVRVRPGAEVVLDVEL